MVAEIISVGTELLLGSTVDTNAAALGRVLSEIGWDCVRRQTVGDNFNRLVSAIGEARERSDLVICIGGLGPTEDDLTRDGIAAAYGLELELDAEVLGALRSAFERRGLRWVESNARQAKRPAGSRALKNPYGTAPGLYGTIAGKHFAAIPGPPNEFNPMVNHELRPILEALSDRPPIVSRLVRTCGIGESRVEELIQDLIHSQDPTVAPYAKLGEVHLRVTSRTPDRIEPMVKEICSRLGSHVYSVNDESLEAAILARLRAANQTVSCAESLTAGALSARICSVPGASDCLLGGIAAYHVEAKAKLLGVSAALMSEESAVSPTVAEEMARGALERFGSTYAMATTGVAGPGPDERGNPEGTVYVAVAGPEFVVNQKVNLVGTRNVIQARSVQSALNFFWKVLSEG